MGMLELRAWGESLPGTVEGFHRQAEMLHEARDLLEMEEGPCTNHTTNIRAPCEGRIHIWGILAGDERCRTKDPLVTLIFQTGVICLIAYDPGAIPRQEKLRP